MGELNLKMKMTMIQMRISNGELANRVGIAPSSVSLIMNGHMDPKLSVAKGIARELGMSLDELWGDHDTHSQSTD